MRDSVRVIVFAAVLGIICSLFLVGATLFTAPYRRANERAEEVRNFLTVLGAPVEKSMDSKTLLQIFDRDVRVKKLGALTLLEYMPASSNSPKPAAVAMPFSGMGVWGPMKGVLALEPDLRTIRGISFYQQEETPGLGGEIAAEWFQKQFVKKEIVSGSGEPGFRVLKPGGTSGKNEVDGITGATMTSNRVQLILDNLAKSIGKERSAYVQ